MSQNAYQTYTTNTASNVGTAQLMSLLFSKAISHLEEAKKAIEEKDVELRYNLTEKVRVILLNLQVSLDRQSDNPDVQNQVALMDGVYTRLCHFLTQINIQNDIKLTEAVIQNLQDLALNYSKVQKEIDGVSQKTAPIIVSEKQKNDEKETVNTENISVHSPANPYAQKAAYIAETAEKMRVNSLA